MISGAGLCWQHVGGVGSTTTTTTTTKQKVFLSNKNHQNIYFANELSMNTSITYKLICATLSLKYPLTQR